MCLLSSMPASTVRTTQNINQNLLILQCTEKTRPNLILYHTKKSQILLIFVIASKTFSVMHT